MDSSYVTAAQHTQTSNKTECLQYKKNNKIQLQ